ncbi:MAG TPA: ATP-binding protein [Chloroflexota bacterium]|jgi:PAS domain S-box-containing protein|nr:ATP-binding protein [Chloroflexota bacterium]
MVQLGLADAGVGELFSRMRDAVVVADADSGRITTWNPAAERLFGYTAEEAVGQPLAILAPERPPTAGRHPLSPGPLVDSDTPCELPARRKDGREIQVELTLSSIGETVSGRERRLVVAVIRDATGRRQPDPADPRLETERAARAEAEAAHRRLEFLSEAGALAATSLDYETTLTSVAHMAVPFLADWCTVYILDDDGQVRRVAVAYANPEHERLAEQLRRFQPSPTSPNSQIAAVLASGRPELVEEIPESYVESIAQGPEHLAIMRQLGFRSSMVVPLAARGSVLGAVAFFTAGSARRYGQADLALAEELARRCALAVDNARLYRRAQDAVRLRDDVLAAVSHDLKGPLTAIAGQAQLIQRRLAQPDALDLADMDEALERIKRATARLSALVNELLDVARLQAGRLLQLHLRTTDLVELARRMADEWQETAPHHRIRVETDLLSLVGTWDQFRLERVLDNLLGNAVKYSPRGGEIVLTIAGDHDRAVLTVRDQGIGIPADDLPRVFERFHRGANVARRTRGSGIGLSGARQIIEQHGGTITVESQERVGSAFTVRLPLRPRSQSGSPPPNQRQP